MARRALLDEDLEHALLRHLPSGKGETATTVQLQGWRSKRNGELLQLAAQAGFDVFITADRDMLHQQNEDALPLPVVVLVPDWQRGETRASLMSNQVVGLLQQELDNRFYVIGSGPRSRREAKERHDRQGQGGGGD